MNTCCEKCFASLPRTVCRNPSCPCHIRKEYQKTHPEEIPTAHIVKDVESDPEAWEKEFDKLVPIEKFKSIWISARQSGDIPKADILNKYWHSMPDTIKDFIRSLLASDRDELIREITSKKVPHEFIGRTEDADTGEEWTGGKGWNEAIEFVLKILKGK
jgi:hypothetical protein